jgi:hypothetical protein
MKTITKEQLAEASKNVRANIKSIRNHPCVRSISDERASEDGFWIYLYDGWVCRNSDGNAISEDTIGDAARCLKKIYYDPATLDGEPEVLLV